MITSITLIIHSFILSKSRFSVFSLYIAAIVMIIVYFSTLSHFGPGCDSGPIVWRFCCHWIYQIFIHNNQLFGYFYWVAIIPLIIIIVMKFFFFALSLLSFDEVKKKHTIIMVICAVVCTSFVLCAWCLSPFVRSLNVYKQREYIFITARTWNKSMLGVRSPLLEKQFDLISLWPFRLRKHAESPEEPPPSQQ